MPDDCVDRKAPPVRVVPSACAGVGKCQGALAEFYGVLCQAICAYFDGIESGDPSGGKLELVLDESRSLFATWLTDGEMANHTVLRDDGSAYHGLYEIRGNAFKNIYACPIWTILHDLRREYDVEIATRSRWAAEAGLMDLIVFGAVTDDWRISRYMHASHAALRQRCTVAASRQ